MREGGKGEGTAKEVKTLISITTITTIAITMTPISIITIVFDVIIKISFTSIKIIITTTVS